MSHATKPTWTTDEHRLLSRLWRQGVPTREIAKQIPRHTLLAVRRRAVHLGLPKREKIRWTDAQQALIFAGLEQFIDHYARRLGRSRGAIVNKTAMLLFSYSRMHARSRRAEDIAV